jgi:hypothetical protein
MLRRATRLVALVALATPGMLLVGTGVAAAAPGLAATNTTKPGVLQEAWYWQTALRQANPPVDPNEVPVTEPSGVPEGDFAVANTNSDGSSSKLSVLAFDIGQLKPENLEELIDQLNDLTVDVDDERTKVRVFAE